MIQIDHKVSQSKLSAMLLPFGVIRNSFLSEVKDGDELMTMDEKIIRVVSISTLPVFAPITNAISLMIYGVGIQESFQVMKRNHGRNIQNEYLYIIIYETVDKT